MNIDIPGFGYVLYVEHPSLTHENQPEAGKICRSPLQQQAHGSEAITIPILRGFSNRPVQLASIPPSATPTNDLQHGNMQLAGGRGKQTVPGRKLYLGDAVVQPHFLHLDLEESNQLQHQASELSHEGVQSDKSQ
jgi:hypothetical protein